MNQCELYQEIISRLVDGELSRSEYAALDAHMENCAECSAMYAVFASLSEIIGSEDEPLPEDLHENIMAGVRRSAMINRNRTKRRLSKPVRNTLAAAACAALVLFAAKGLDPAEKAQGTMVSKSEAMVMDAVTEERAEEIIVAQPEAAPAEAPAAAAAAVPSPAPAQTPTATPAPTRDIYLDPVATAAPVSTPAPVTASPAPIVVQTPVFVSTPQPAATQAPVQAEQASPAPEAAYEPAPASLEPETEQAAPAAEAPATDTAPAAVSGEEGAAAEESPAMAAAPEAAPAEPKETPSAQSRLFAFFGMARPASDESAEESAAEAGPLATESPAEETPEAENAVIEEVAESPQPEEKEEPLPVIKLKELEKLSQLENMIDGMEEALPERKADEGYCFCLAEPGEMFKDYKLEVYIIEGKIWYKQIFAEDDFITCSSKCKLEDFEKFMDSLSDEEKAELIKPSPSPEAVPGESPAPEQNEAKN